MYIGHLPDRWSQLGALLGAGMAQGLQSFRQNWAKETALNKLQEILSGGNSVTPQQLVKTLAQMQDPLAKLYALQMFKQVSGIIDPSKQWLKMGPGDIYYNWATGKLVKAPEKPMKVKEGESIVDPNTGKTIYKGKRHLTKNDVVTVLDQGTGRQLLLPYDNAVNLQKKNPDRYVLPQKVTLTKTLSDGRIRKVEVPFGSKMYNKLIKQGFEVGDIEGTPELKASQALKRISQIKKAMATLDKTDVVTTMLASLDPSLKNMVGQKISPALKKQLIEQWNKEIAYLNKFIPEGYQSESIEDEALLPPNPKPESKKVPEENYYRKNFLLGR